MKKTFRHAASMSVLCAAFMVVAPNMALAQEAGRVARVQIEGAERIEPQTILSYLTVQPGDDYNQMELSESTKALYATGLFADVSIMPQNGVLVVNVVENPLINVVAFEGNDKLKREELFAEIASRPRNVLSRNTVQSDVERVRELYRRSGRFSAQVEPKVIKLDQNRVNLVFEVNEGPVSNIRGIKFVGNKEFSDSALRGAIVSKESRWYRFLNPNDRFDQDRMAYDQELLRRFYLRNGYADFRVVSAIAEITPDREAFFVTMTVEEGERYRVNNVSVDTSAVKDAPEGFLLEDLEVKSGQWYDADRVEYSVENMTTTLGENQHVFLAVEPDVRRNVADKTVDIYFRAVPTQRVFVEAIDIKGNVRTQDKVIRREFDLVEGDPLNRNELAKAEQSLRDLDFFETVRVRPVQGSSPDQTVLDVEVQEKSTGEISIGAGFSTEDGPLADFSIRERNFLGKGQEVSLSTLVAGKRSEFDVSFTEPFFLDRDMAAGFDLFHMTRDLQDESSYDQRRTGGALRLGYPLGRDLRQTLRYRLENNAIRNIKPGASLYIREQEGKYLTSAVSQRLSYDRRDSTLDAHRGYLLWLDTEFAGLGGDAQFVSGKIGGKHYYPIARNWIISTTLEGGAIGAWGDHNVRINERFNLGGDSLRGFKYGGIGPRDIRTDDALGGNLFYRGSAELSFPTGLPEELGLGAHAFTDMGSLWKVDQTGPGIADSKSIRIGAGIGVSWKSPMGPIRVDFATPVKKEKYDDAERFRFSFGTRF